MGDELKDSDKAALHLDMWKHQNELIWGRFKTLIQIQTAVVVLQAVADTWLSQYLVGFFGAVLTGMLLMYIAADKAIRDYHTAQLKNLSFDPAATEPAQTRNYEKKSYVMIFVMFIVLDIVLAIFHHFLFTEHIRRL